MEHLFLQIQMDSCVQMHTRVKLSEVIQMKTKLKLLRGIQSNYWGRMYPPIPQGFGTPAYKSFTYAVTTVCNFSSFPGLAKSCNQ